MPLRALSCDAVHCESGISLQIKIFEKKDRLRGRKRRLVSKRRHKRVSICYIDGESNLRKKHTRTRVQHESSNTCVVEASSTTECEPDHFHVPLDSTTTTTNNNNETSKGKFNSLGNTFFLQGEEAERNSKCTQDNHANTLTRCRDTFSARWRSSDHRPLLLKKPRLDLKNVDDDIYLWKSLEYNILNDFLLVFQCFCGTISDLIGRILLLGHFDPDFIF